MANTRQSSKRARQNKTRNERNTSQKNTVKSVLKKALVAIQKKDLEGAKAAYVEAVRALSKAASKGLLPASRASRKISRLTQLAKKALPQALNFS